MNPMTSLTARLRPMEKRWLAFGCLVVLVFGIVLEIRTALRRVPMTDLGVYCVAAHAIGNGGNPYLVSEWHQWHYHYPPFLSIVFRPFAMDIQPAPTPGPTPPGPGEMVPWGRQLPGQRGFYGLHADNARFFVIVLAWYVASVAMVLASVHALACALAGASFLEGPPEDAGARREWWRLRVVPLLACIGSVGTELSRGQVDVVMLLAVAAGIYWATRRRELWAGMALAVPAAIKLFPPVILLLPAWRRRWRMFGGVFMGLALTWVLVPWAALGTGRTLELYRTWFEVLARPSLGQGNDASRARELTNMNATDNQSLLNVIHNMAHRSVPRAQRPPRASDGARLAVNITGAALLLACAWVAGVRREDSPVQFMLVAGLWIAIALVVSPVVHGFYYIMAIPLLAALVFLAGRPRPPCPPWVSAVVVGGFGVVDLVTRFPGIGPFLRERGATLFSLAVLMILSGWSLRRISGRAIPSLVRPARTLHAARP